MADAQKGEVAMEALIGGVILLVVIVVAIIAGTVTAISAAAKDSLDDE